jgi:hypothetical protein
MNVIQLPCMQGVILLENRATLIIVIAEGSTFGWMKCFTMASKLSLLIHSNIEHAKKTFLVQPMLIIVNKNWAILTSEVVILNSSFNVHVFR